MALDHALARELQPEGAVLRLYEWSRPTLSFGRNQRARDAYDEAHIRAGGFDLVRRPTGGRAVLHDQELTYSVVLPLRAHGGLREAYRRINEGLVAGLRSLGVPAEMSGAVGPNLPPEAGACFAAPAEGEVVVAGRKLVGSAQARVEGSLLQHGSLLLRGDQDRVLRLERESGGGVGSPEGPSGLPVAELPAATPFITLSEVLGKVPARDRLVEALVSGVTEVLGGSWAETGPSEQESEVAEELRKLYESSEWTWRR